MYIVTRQRYADNSLAVEVCGDEAFVSPTRLPKRYIDEAVPTPSLNAAVSAALKIRRVWEGSTDEPVLLSYKEIVGGYINNFKFLSADKLRELANNHSRKPKCPQCGTAVEKSKAYVLYGSPSICSVTCMDNYVGAAVAHYKQLPQ